MKDDQMTNPDRKNEPKFDEEFSRFEEYVKALWENRSDFVIKISRPPESSPMVFPNPAKTSLDSKAIANGTNRLIDDLLLPGK